jgi:hypothetical protein
MPVGDLDVVARADEDQVVDVGGSAVGPGEEVVDLAVLAGGGAAGDDAADVPGEQGGLLGGGGQPVGAAQVQHGAVRVQDDPADAGGAGQQRQRAGVHRPAVLSGREPPGDPAAADARRAAEAGEAVEGGLPGWVVGGQGVGVRELVQGGGDDDLDVGVGAGADPGWPAYLELALGCWFG